jgi:murein DD-endopeptidase MepM/ murein hydrolase activator NlpD
MVGMNKAKANNAEKKYLSIVLVPHSSSNVKVFRFTSFYAKLVICFILLTAVFIGGGLYISKMLEENKALKQNINELYSTNSEQRKLINEKSSEVDQLKDESSAFKETVNDKIEEYTKNFNKITDTYIKEQTSTKTNRSGDRNGNSFTNDIKVLKSSIDDLSQLYSRTVIPVADLTKAETKLEKYLETIPTLWPVRGDITDNFGYRKDPFTRRTKFHEGIDIGADRGTSIKAAASGKIIMSERTSGLGLTVKIDHGRGIVTLYGHASKLLVKVGQIVKKGDVIAKVGSSGRSTGPHLHFQVMLYGTTVDPLQYLDER